MLLTSALDMLEVGKSSRTSPIICAQPLGTQWAQGRAVLASSVTLSSAWDSESGMGQAAP